MLDKQPDDVLTLLRSYARMTVWSTGRLTPEFGAELDRGDMPLVMRVLEESAAILIQEAVKAPEDFPELLLSQVASIQLVLDLLHDGEPSPDTNKLRLH